MAFFKKGNIYQVTQTPSYSRSNILGISFTKKANSEDTIEVIEWNFPKSNFRKLLEKRTAKWNQSDSSKIKTSKEEVLKQVLSGLNWINEALGTDYPLSKIYYVPSENGSDCIYKTLIIKLIRHYYIS